MQNKYYKRSRISEAKFREIIKYFAMDFDATKISELTKISRNTINNILGKVRKTIFMLDKKTAVDYTQIHLEDHYIKGKKKGETTINKHIFGLFKKDNKIHVEIVNNCTKEQLKPLIQGEKIDSSASIHTNVLQMYDGLVINGYKQYTVFHNYHELESDKYHHVNGIKSFWSFCKRRLAKFNGLTNDKFILHLKECEFRFNNRQNDLYHLLLKILRNNPIA